jgi:hypothetical protein
MSHSIRILKTKQKYSEYRHTADFERFRKEAREKAQQQARMRYEKFKKQHEAFQESGINDIALLFTALIRLFSIPFFLGLALTPIALAFVSWQWIFMGIVMWPVATIIGWYMMITAGITCCPVHFIIPFEAPACSLTRIQ